MTHSNQKLNNLLDELNKISDKSKVYLPPEVLDYPSESLSIQQMRNHTDKLKHLSDKLTDIAEDVHMIVYGKSLPNDKNTLAEKPNVQNAP